MLFYYFVNNNTWYHFKYFYSFVTNNICASLKRNIYFRFHYLSLVYSVMMVSTDHDRLNIGVIVYTQRNCCVYLKTFQMINQVSTFNRCWCPQTQGFHFNFACNFRSIQVPILYAYSLSQAPSYNINSDQFLPRDPGYPPGGIFFTKYISPFFLKLPKTSINVQ